MIFKPAPFRFLLVGVISCLTTWHSGQVHAQTAEQQSSSLRGTHDGGEERELQDALRTQFWDEHFIKRGQRATNLTHLVKAEDLMDTIDYYNTEVYQMFMAWDDGINDRSLVAKDDDVCYIVFQGMNRHVIWDYVQTLSPLRKRKVFGSDCDVRRSFYRAYETIFADDMRAYLDTCVKSCANGECPVVIGGHSTAAATATIAALDPRLQQYKPTTYALAPMPSILNECEDIQNTNIFRIVAANAGYYDAASDGSPKIGRHYGQFFIMDELNQFYYIGKDDDTLRMPDNYNIHIIEVYLNRMNALANRESPVFPMALAQFPVGHWCNFDDECNPGHCADGICNYLPDGRWCRRDYECQSKNCVSGLCKTDPARYGTMATDPETAEEDAALYLAGSPCTEDSQCLHNVCLLGKCTLESGKAATGSPCEENSQCEADKCFEGYCQPKLYNGSWCKEDYECLSNSCSGPMSWIQMRKCADPPPE